MKGIAGSALIATIFSGFCLPVTAGEFTLGAGVEAFKSPYKGFNDDSAGMPIVEYQGKDLSIGVDGLNYRLLGDEESPLNLYASVASTNEGFDSADSAAFVGMSERDMSVEVGLTLDYRIGDSHLSTTFLHDISDTHDGLVADIHVSHGFDLSGYAALSPTLGFNYLSKEYADYYFGVRNTEATLSRAAYQADAAINPYVGIELMVPLNDNWQLIHGANYTWLSDELKNSSIVDRDNSWSVMMAVAYTF